ncbi:serine dehydratase subunit alpha family protein [Prevotella sp. E13-27]|uniref:L-cysteine desulfidase family protein n=1 Tax=Prevotella sp. E13-27 TaxID=2938122 RepID=UPI00200AA862|nr:L-serine ammonia-lyase, iron-sulfur-dependent, subunit alpha [Prevotella sp. E13-27]MCK8623681.1 L-serine ammonia-lyase, iron-sulfur-dependent, subunit alpha [Prevotella sp. E13-27]
MIDAETRQRIIKLVNREVVPAIGCTEPMCVALCTARATELLGRRPERIEARLSANILKNAMGVGIPGTGMIGLPIAIALGALIGKSEYRLEVLKDLTPKALEEGKKFIAEERIDIQLKTGITEKLYVEMTCIAGEKRATAVIAGTHTHFVEPADASADVKTLKLSDESCDKDIELNMRLVYDFATTAPLEEIRFIEETRRYNMNAAREAIKGNYGHNLGKTIDRPLSKGIFGNSIYAHIISRTASACDARMGGAMIPVMSNSGSGNQGICATNPVCVYAKENENTEEELIRALMLSHLTAIYIKQSLGALSALCGCVVASIGSSVGITYLMGGGYEHVCRSVKNMVANLTGMICDGAKPSCSLKITSGVSTALLSALLSMEGKCVTSAEGIVDDCVDRSIHNLTAIGANGMGPTDEMVLNIMTSKGC